MRNGRAGRKSHELIGFDWPLISPTLVPVSVINTWPKRSRPLAHDHHTLIIRRPGDVFDWATNGLKLILKDVLLVDSVPDANLARLIYTHTYRKLV